MGQYVVVENEGRYCFNLCASNGHILMSSIIFPSKDECLHGIECVRASAADAEIEDSTIDAFDRESRARTPTSTRRACFAASSGPARSATPPSRRTRTSSWQLARNTLTRHAPGVPHSGGVC